MEILYLISEGLTVYSKTSGAIKILRGRPVQDTSRKYSRQFKLSKDYNYLTYKQMSVYLFLHCSISYPTIGMDPLIFDNDHLEDQRSVVDEYFKYKARKIERTVADSELRKNRIQKIPLRHRLARSNRNYTEEIIPTQIQEQIDWREEFYPLISNDKPGCNEFHTQESKKDLLALLFEKMESVDSRTQTFTEIGPITILEFAIENEYPLVIIE